MRNPGAKTVIRITAERGRAVWLGAAFSLATLVSAGSAGQPSGGAEAPFDWTTEQDHGDMQRQLGIRALRPGPSGRADAPNPANYDEAIANPFPDWPDPLRLADGTPVSSATIWWDERRPQIVEAFEREVIGRVPDPAPAVEWSIVETDTATLAGRRVTGKQLTGRVESRSAPMLEVAIELTLVVPADAAQPVPVMIMFRSGSLQQALGNEPSRRLGPATADPPAAVQLIEAGWGFAFLNPTSVQADNGAGLTRGIIGLANRGHARKPDDWGSLRAWAWGASRALDYLETDPAVDAERVGIEGVSRYGKAALVAMAFEPRFAVALIGSSGEGGVAPYRRNFGEMVENLTGVGEYHWMAGNFLKYGAAEADFGSMNAGDLPVDAHMLLALSAPRPVFVSYGVPEQGDALWLDQRGSYMATVAAAGVYRLLGAAGPGAGQDYRHVALPAVNDGLLDGVLAWRQHDGGHTDGPNWRHFIPWAARELGLAAHASATSVEPATTRPARRADRNSEIAHADLVAKARQGIVDVYFVGDSITRRWGALDYPELLAHWNQSFFGWNAANFAWGGDRTQNMLWRLAHGELDGLSPKVFVIQAGTNNLPDYAEADTAVAAIAAGIEALVEVCLAHSPSASVVLTGVFPRSDAPQLNPLIARINARLASYAGGTRVRFVDISDRLARADGRLRADMSDDGLHLSLAGYRVWAAALQPILAELLGPPGRGDFAPPPTGNPAARAHR